MRTCKGVVVSEYSDKWDVVGPYDDWVAHRPPVGVYVSGTVEVGWPFAVAVPGGDVILTNERSERSERGWAQISVVFRYQYLYINLKAQHMALGEG